MLAFLQNFEKIRLKTKKEILLLSITKFRLHDISNHTNFHSNQLISECARINRLKSRILESKICRL